MNKPSAKKINANNSTYDPSLWNADLAPTLVHERTWSSRDFASLWIGMAACVPTYLLAGGLVDLGMSWWQAVLTVLLGNVVVLLPMLLCAHAGTKYGIPFPVLSRASFGTRGAHAPAILRGLVACGWFGIQTWIGGSAIYQMAGALRGAPLGGAPLPVLGINTAELICFLLFWALEVAILWRGMESIKRLENWAAPFLVVMSLGLLAWAAWRAGGLGPMFSQPSQFGVGGAKPGQLWSVFWPGLTAMVGFWATLSLNIPDFTRYAKDQRAQVIGQAIGLPTFMTLFSFIGVAVTSATVVIFGEAIPDPTVLLGRLGNGGAVLLSLLALSIATLSTNLAANVVSPANAVVNLNPRRFSFRAGALLTAALGVAIFPWKIIASSQGYIFTWLVGYSALLGPIGGIVIADYWILRRTQLDVPALYRRGGPYHYRHGWNIAALLALVAGIAPNVPGFLFEAGLVGSVPALFKTIYTYAWFVGFALSGGLFLLLSRTPLGAAAPSAPQSPDQPR